MGDRNDSEFQGPIWKKAKNQELVFNVNKIVPERALFFNKSF